MAVHKFALGDPAHRWVSFNWNIYSAYDYDGISRLNIIVNGFTSSSYNVTSTFAYNPASQITTRTRDNDAYRFTGYALGVTRSYAANGLNQYASVGGTAYGYDSNGNLTADGSTAFTYDAENRLVVASTGANLVYDPLGRLYETSTSGAGVTRFLYDGDELVAEYDGSGNMLRRYVHGAQDDDPLVWYEGAGVSSPRYLYSDHQGSVVAITDASGNVTNINAYDEYGIPNGYGGAGGTPNVGRFQFTGQAWIPELGMYYYKARIYSPTLGRFLQTDPVGYDDQVNLYAYVANDPVNGRDPSGLSCEANGGPCKVDEIAYKKDDGSIGYRTATANDQKTYGTQVSALTAARDAAAAYGDRTESMTIDFGEGEGTRTVEITGNELAESLSTKTLAIDTLTQTNAQAGVLDGRISIYSNGMQSTGTIDSPAKMLLHEGFHDTPQQNVGLGGARLDTPPGRQAHQGPYDRAAARIWCSSNPTRGC